MAIEDRLAETKVNDRRTATISAGLRRRFDRAG